MVFYMKDCLNKYIEDDELEKLLANKNSFEVPFLYYLKETIIESNNYSGFTKQNIISSFKIIEHYDYQWLTQNKKRLLNCNDVTEAISATGELRCYGYCQHLAQKMYDLFRRAKNQLRILRFVAV